ncbi:MAG: M20 metallopeptidase family protein [Acidimicrobiales bacterium]
MESPPGDHTLLDEARRHHDDIVEVRRQIHRTPELGLTLPRTQATILEALDGLGLAVTTGEATTSVVAVLDSGRPGPTTLLRGDMDALPLTEDTGLPFASEVEHAMHACGHDGHVAMLVGAARLLAGRRSQLTGRVVFMFQPGEEGAGGARVMLEEGLLRRFGPVDRAFALHLTPLLPSGWIGTRAGTLLASADEFRVVVTGRGGHASMPHDAVDPVPVACEIVTALQTMVTRRIAAFDPAVLTIASIRAGTTFNVIPEVAVLEGTVRAVSDPARREALDGLARVASGIAAAHLCRAEVVPIEESYPVTVNDADAASRTLTVGREVLGADRVVEMPTPVMGAEDWSYVLQQVPGSMAFLGAAPAGVEHPAPNHSNRMMIDEQALASGVAMHAAMALAGAAQPAR